MLQVRYSRLAEADLTRIAVYTRDRFGKEQAVRYIDDLESCCLRLAENAGMGRACDEIGTCLRRFEHVRHVIFYRKKKYGILISRILHAQMLPARHSMEK